MSRSLSENSHFRLKSLYSKFSDRLRGEGRCCVEKCETRLTRGVLRLCCDMKTRVSLLGT